jgi:NADH-quinone oxidoreductase subunit N
VALHELVNQLRIDTLASLWPFAPEIALCVTIVVMLLVRIPRWGRWIDAFWLMLIGSGLALYLAAPWEHLAADGMLARQELFTGMLVYDGFTVFLRFVLLGFAVLFALLTKLSGIPDQEDAPDIYTLVLGSTLGLSLMASANHLLMVFLAVEMASVPSYALAGILKGRRKSSEAALKYSVYGAGAAGVMLYGISLVAGMLNTAHLPTIAVELARMDIPSMLAQGQGLEQLMVLVLGGLMIMVGLAFKLSAVPFHFWCPDVFEGATAEVNAFLSVSSKAAALALLVRVAVGMGMVPASAGIDATLAAEPPSAAQVHFVADVAEPAKGHAADEAHPAPAAGAAVPGEPASADATEASRRLAPIRDFAARLIAVLAAVTCTFGNLAAYGQTNIKRLLAYSTIAHAGYMMMPVPAALALAGVNNEAAAAAVAALAIYIGVYLFMNLGAFAIVAFLRNAMRSEEIADYAGLIRRRPDIVVCLSIILFGLIGLPPLSGFIGKFAAFAALVEGYRITGQFYLVVLLVVGGINTAVSLFYYLRVVKTMTMDPEPADRLPLDFGSPYLQGAYIWAVTAPTVILFFYWDFLSQWAQVAVRHLVA